MAITWKTLLRRRGSASLKEYAAGRGITTYDQLCDSFDAHGLTSPTREEAGDFLQEVPIPPTSSPESSPDIVPEEPAAEILYEPESAGDRRRRRRQENFDTANKPKEK
jgi:hypothetical protein